MKNGVVSTYFHEGLVTVVGEDGKRWDGDQIDGVSHEGALCVFENVYVPHSV